MMAKAGHDKKLTAWKSSSDPVCVKRTGKNPTKPIPRPIHFFFEMEIRKKGGKERRKAINETCFGGREVLQAPKF
jgi:hypothetical protein